MNVTLRQDERYTFTETESGMTRNVFTACYEKSSTRRWKTQIFEKIREFAVAIKSKTGYSVLLNSEHEDVLDDDTVDGLDVVHVEIVGARHTYVFFITDHLVEYIIQKEVFKHG